jgi:hypothetical protein
MPKRDQVCKGDNSQESTATTLRRAHVGLMLMSSSLEPWCAMPNRPSDEDVSRQILSIFIRHRIPASGVLPRNYFLDVRDSDFQRGINNAVANNWIAIDLRNRYRYQLTATGYAAGGLIVDAPINAEAP